MYSDSHEAKTASRLLLIFLEMKLINYFKKKYVRWNIYLGISRNKFLSNFIHVYYNKSKQKPFWISFKFKGKKINNELLQYFQKK